MADAARVRDDLAQVIRQMVDRPDLVQVAAVPMRRATVLEVRAAPEDQGKIIGRRGRTARALRALLDNRGDGEGAQYGLEILDE